MSEQYDFVRRLREKQSLEGAPEGLPEGALAEELQTAPAEIEPLCMEPLYQEAVEDVVPGVPRLIPGPDPIFCGHCGQSLMSAPHSERRHSRLGMAATAKSFMLGFLLVGSILIALILPEGTPDIWYSLIALVWMGVLSAAVLGMGISLPGLLRKNRHNLFPVMGMVFNGLIVGCVILLALFCTACYLLYPEAGTGEDDYDFVRRILPETVKTV